MPTMYGLARLGRDAEIRYTPNGDPVATLSLAFNYGKRDADGKRKTQWVRGSIWGKQAEALSPYLTKGAVIVVTLDDVHIEEFKGRDGTPGYALAGRVQAVELAGGQQRQDGGGEQQAPARRAAPPAARQTPQQRQADAAAQSTGFDDMDDDIPF